MTKPVPDQPEWLSFLVEHIPSREGTDLLSYADIEDQYGIKSAVGWRTRGELRPAVQEKRFTRFQRSDVEAMLRNHWIPAKDRGAGWYMRPISKSWFYRRGTPDPRKTPPTLLTGAEVLKILGLPPRVKIRNGSYRYRKSDLDQWLRSHGVKADD